MNLFDRNLNCVILTLKVLITTAAHTILHFYPHAFFKKKAMGILQMPQILGVSRAFLQLVERMVQIEPLDFFLFIFFILIFAFYFT